MASERHIYVKANVNVAGMRPGQARAFAKGDPLYEEMMALANDERGLVERITRDEAEALGIAQPDDTSAQPHVADALNAGGTPS